MDTKVKNLPKSSVEITVELSIEEMRPYLEHAAAHLQEHKTIPGFRPGKAPMDVTIKHFGEVAVWEEAAEEAVRKSFLKVVQEQNLATIGSPKIDLTKLAPGNPFIFKATVPVAPETILGDYTKIAITKKPIEIKDETIEKSVHDLCKMQSKEVVSTKPLGEHDKVAVDMSISLDSVPIDGGQAKNHSIYMDEEYYIPGLKEKIIGIAKGETREFKLPFPKTHYNKTLAGKEADFKVTVVDIFELQRPTADDSFAQSLGQKDLATLKTLIKKNLEDEAKHKEDERQEIELLESAVAQTKFSDLPEILINEEIAKMVHELQEGISRQGVTFEDYLKKLGKTIDDLKLDFTSQAIKRVKTALLLNKLAETNKLEVPEKELDAEVDRVAALYKNDEKSLESIHSLEARGWLEHTLLNRKVIEWLRTQIK